MSLYTIVCIGLSIAFLSVIFHKDGPWLHFPFTVSQTSHAEICNYTSLALFFSSQQCASLIPKSMCCIYHLTYLLATIYHFVLVQASLWPCQQNPKIWKSGSYIFSSVCIYCRTTQLLRIIILQAANILKRLTSCRQGINNGLGKEEEKPWNFLVSAWYIKYIFKFNQIGGQRHYYHQSMGGKP